EAEHVPDRRFEGHAIERGDIAEPLHQSVGTDRRVAHVTAPSSPSTSVSVRLWPASRTCRSAPAPADGTNVHCATSSTRTPSNGLPGTSEAYEETACARRAAVPTLKPCSPRPSAPSST